jgi:hypothetical protein
MVQPNYTPEEKMERIKLMFQYNLNKTLSENKSETKNITPPIKKC